MNSRLKAFIVLLLAALSLHAQDIPNPMDPPRMVNDFAQVFDDSQRNTLENVLLSYNDSTSTQIYVVTIKDLNGYAVSDYAARLGQKWGIGQEGKDNGVLILIKPRIGSERGQVFIATGYGVEHILTDGRCGRIIDEQMMPYLAEGDYYGGTLSAVNRIIKYLSGEYRVEEEEIDDMELIIIVLLMVLGFAFLLFLIKKDGNNGGSNGGSTPNRGGGFGGFGGFGGGDSFGGGGFGGLGGGGSGRGFGGGGGGRFGGGGGGRSF